MARETQHLAVRSSPTFARGMAERMGSVRQSCPRVLDRQRYPSIPPSSLFSTEMLVRILAEGVAALHR